MNYRENGHNRSNPLASLNATPYAFEHLTRTDHADCHRTLIMTVTIIHRGWWSNASRGRRTAGADSGEH